MRAQAAETGDVQRMQAWGGNRCGSAAPSPLADWCHPFKGSSLYPARYGTLIREALGRAGVNQSMREFHDWRHTGITNAAAAGMPPIAIMRMAGHTNFATTQRYLDLADAVFGDEVSLLGVWYGSSGYQTGVSSSPPRTNQTASLPGKAPAAS